MNANSRIQLRTGRAMPVLGLGTWELTRETARTVAYALRRGYRMIDTAVDYGSQPGIGEALARGEVPREEIFLVQKVEENDDGYEAVKRDLAEMRQDYADLVLIHRPPPNGSGAQIWEGLMRARDEGLVRDLGVSNYSIDDLVRLTESWDEIPTVNQIEWTPFGWDRDMLEYCRERQIVIQAYSPLTRGERLDDPHLLRLADAYEVTTAQLLLAWCMQKGVVPLPKANRRDHLVENLDAFDVSISEQHMEELDGLNEGYSALGRTLQYVGRG